MVRCSREGLGRRTGAASYLVVGLTPLLVVCFPRVLPFAAPSRTGANRNEATEQAILELLAKSEGCIDTLAIAKAIKGPHAVKKDVNPHLYALQKEGQLQMKTTKKTKRPFWSLAGLERPAKASAPSQARPQSQPWPALRPPGLEDQETSGGELGGPPPETMTETMAKQTSQRGGSAPSKLVQKVKASLEDKDKFLDLHNSLQPKISIDSPVMERAVKKIENAARIWCFDTENDGTGDDGRRLELIGSALLGVDIEGSDVDYAIVPLNNEATEMGEWDRFYQSLNAQGLSEVVPFDRDGIIGISVFVEHAGSKREIQIVPKNGPFAYAEVAPYYELLPKKVHADIKENMTLRAAVQEELVRHFAACDGCRRALRVLKAVLLEATKDEAKGVPQSTLLTMMFYHCCKSWKDKGEVDDSGLRCFKHFLFMMSNFNRHMDRSQTPMKVLRLAKQRGTAQIEGKILEMWQHRAKQIMEP